MAYDSSRSVGGENHEMMSDLFSGVVEYPQPKLFVWPADANGINQSELPASRKPELPPSHTSASIGAIKKKPRARRCLSCTFCRRLKQKCDRKLPCSNCIKKNGGNCEYESDPKTTTAVPKAGSFAAELLSLKPTQPVADSVSLNLGKMVTMDNFLSDRIRSGPEGPAGVSGLDMKTRLDKMENLVLSLLMQKDKSSPGGDDGAVNGGGLNESEEVDELGESLGMLKLDRKGKSVYHGDTYWGYLLSEITEIQEVLQKIRKEFDNSEAFGRDRFESLCQVTDGQQDSSNIPFAGVQYKSSNQDILKTIPSREICEMLVDRFFEAVEPVLHIIHRPSFQVGFNTFWQEPEKTELLWVSQLLGMITLALQSYSPQQVPEPFKDKEVESWTKWLSSMEICGFIGKLTFKPSLLNIRVLLLWMLLEAYQSDWIHKSWTSMGVLVRVAHSMGMHRDPSWFVLTPFEMEERRRLWTSVQFLDSFHSVGQGLPLGIRKHENDVHEPLNINDVDIMPHYGHLPVQVDLATRTDSSYMIFRGRLNDLRSEAFTRNLKIDGKVDSLSLEEVWELDKQLRTLYKSRPSYFHPRADESSSSDSVDLVMQRFMLEIDFYKTVIVLHRTFSSNGLRNPKYQRNREEALNASVTILERFHWLYLTAEAEEVRNRFWLVASALTFTSLIHAIMFVAVSLINNFDNFSVAERTRYLEGIRRTRHVLDCVGSTITCDFRHAAIAKMLIGQVEEVASLTREQRIRRTSRNASDRQPSDFGMLNDDGSHRSGKPKASMMELDTSDANIQVEALSSGNWSTDQSPESMQTNASASTKATSEDDSASYRQGAMSEGPTPNTMDQMLPDALFDEAYRMEQIVGPEEWEYFVQSMDGQMHTGMTPDNMQ
jgi:hypothetical protein